MYDYYAVIIRAMREPEHIFYGEIGSLKLHSYKTVYVQNYYGLAFR